jgi:hypothetical protein
VLSFFHILQEQIEKLIKNFVAKKQNSKWSLNSRWLLKLNLLQIIFFQKKIVAWIPKFYRKNSWFVVLTSKLSFDSHFEFSGHFEFWFLETKFFFFLGLLEDYAKILAFWSFWRIWKLLEKDAMLNMGAILSFWYFFILWNLGILTTYYVKTNFWQKRRFIDFRSKSNFGCHVE